MLRKYSFKNFNFALVVFVIALTSYGIYIIGSAKASVQGKQEIGFALGLFLMLVLSVVDYSFILKFYWVIYLVNLVLLTSVMIFGDAGKGAQRWISIFGFRFQPSELAKILLILFYAQFIMKRKEKLNTFKVFLQSILLIIPPLILVFKQPDLSTTIMLFLIFSTLLFVGGLSWKIIIGIFSVAIPVLVIMLMLVIQPDQKIIKDYQQTRILAWLQPDKYSNTEGYQQQNSIIAIGSGKLQGKGYKNNEVGSVKNGNFISEPQTDFIFAIVGEELGFIGCFAILLLEMILVVLVVQTGRKAQDLAGTLICAGVAANIGFQSFMNIAVTTGLMPNTGIPLPFVSYGSTSLVSLYIGLGMVLNVGLQPVDARSVG